MRAFVALRRCMSIDLTYVCDVVMYDSRQSPGWTSARVELGLSGMYLYVDSTYHLRGRGADEGSKHRSARPPRALARGIEETLAPCAPLSAFYPYCCVF